MQISRYGSNDRIVWTMLSQHMLFSGGFFRVFFILSINLTGESICCCCLDEFCVRCGLKHTADHLRESRLFVKMSTATLVKQLMRSVGKHSTRC